MGIQFIVENGTGLSNATTYASLDEIKQYWENSGYDFSSYTDDQLRIQANKGTKYIDNQYRKRYTGTRDSSTQSLEWPRESAYYKADETDIDDSTIPIELKNAVAEYAYGVLTGSATTQPVVSSTGAIEEEMVQVDVIIESKKYASPSTYRRDFITAMGDALSRLIGSANPYDIKIVRVGG